MKLLVSACLLGVNCKYSGGNNQISEDKIRQLKSKYEIVPICPEIYGGLSTPRLPSEIRDGKVYAKDGTDVTKQYEKGACEVLHMAEMLECKSALLKLRSPSCGHGKIYDGSFSGTLINGDGITAAKLKNAGIRIYGEDEIETLI